MGLDIYIATDKDDVFSANGSEGSLANEYCLSRSFCNFMCRRNAIGHEPELEQIGRITGIDITPFYEMESHTIEEELEYHLTNAESDDERQAILRNAEETNNALQGNLEKVWKTAHELIVRLNTIENLPALLLPTDFDSLGNQEYFADFRQDKGDGYIGNNFGRDLRNFKSNLDLAKAKGATTVWFIYM